jgi:hypothetical protein
LYRPANVSEDGSTAFGRSFSAYAAAVAASTPLSPSWYAAATAVRASSVAAYAMASRSMS